MIMAVWRKAEEVNLRMLLSVLWIMQEAMARYWRSFVEKAYNSKRQDHTLEHRKSEHGKNSKYEYTNV